MKPITAEWIKKGEEDYRVAKELLVMNPQPKYAICFHAQQSIEKYLKAVLQENQIMFEKTHDLDILAEKCEPFCSALINHREDLLQLSVYAVDVRYPGFDLEDSEVVECIRIMEVIIPFIKNYFQEK
ncbi:MAG: HEPN domain-containing protein [Bacteroidetes bacterium]|nr:HEPN domain-containing protein [Bacteroidota bacterium]